MKSLNSILLSFALLVGGCSAASAQEIIDLKKENYLPAFKIEVTHLKTTHVIFPHAIDYVDPGTNQLVSQQVPNVSNILALKAVTSKFAPTNLTVVTKSGQYYSFVVSYAVNPAQISIVLKDIPASGNKSDAQGAGTDGATASTGPMAVFTELGMNQVQMEEISERIITKKRTVRDVGTIAYEMSFALQGVYAKGNAFFYHTHLLNKSNINYDIEFVRFFVRDRKTAKQTVAQEEEIFPVYVLNGDLKTVHGKGHQDRVYVLRKMTIPDDKDLVVQMHELGGGRHLEFKITDQNILDALMVE